jgi:hypothetical protein
MATHHQIPMNISSSIDPLEIIRDRKGKFTKVYYTNQKGQTKGYTVRTGVKKHLMGGSKPHVPDSITVYSVTAGNTGYKTFVKKGIQSIVSKGQQLYPQHPVG